jgi:hypothetical protein
VSSRTNPFLRQRLVDLSAKLRRALDENVSLKRMPSSVERNRKIELNDQNITILQGMVSSLIIELPPNNS